MELIHFFSKLLATLSLTGYSMAEKHDVSGSEMPLIGCTRISISVTKCPLAQFSPISTSFVSRNTDN